MAVSCCVKPGSLLLQQGGERTVLSHRKERKKRCSYRSKVRRRTQHILDTKNENFLWTLKTVLDFAFVALSVAEMGMIRMQISRVDKVEGDKKGGHF